MPCRHGTPILQACDVCAAEREVPPVPAPPPSQPAGPIVFEAPDLLGGVEQLVTLAAQLDCATRELRKRHEVYPRLVGLGKMSQDKASSELRGMRAIIETLQRVIRGEAKIGL